MHLQHSFPLWWNSHYHKSGQQTPLVTVSVGVWGTIDWYPKGTATAFHTISPISIYCWCVQVPLSLCWCVNIQVLFTGMVTWFNNWNHQFIELFQILGYWFLGPPFILILFWVLHYFYFILSPLVKILQLWVQSFLQDFWWFCRSLKEQSLRSVLGGIGQNWVFLCMIWFPT